MKLSSISSVTFLTVCALAFMVHRHHCFEIRAYDYLKRKLFGPAKPLPPVEENHRSNRVFDEKEHGSFDGLGRDIIRQTSKTYRSIKDKIKRTFSFSRDTKGLDCNKTLSGGSKENFKSTVGAIYPGTKWCGDGNKSDSFDDLGKYFLTDACCREHDVCPDNMAADEIKYGLVNTGLFTRSHCDCDRKFYECLKEADTFLSKSIGYTYFTILGPQCFRQDYPIVDCVEEKRRKCETYLTDQNGNKVYQWFDSPVF